MRGAPPAGAVYRRAAGAGAIFAVAPLLVPVAHRLPAEARAVIALASVTLFLASSVSRGTGWFMPAGALCATGMIFWAPPLPLLVYAVAVAGGAALCADALRRLRRADKSAPGSR